MKLLQDCLAALLTVTDFFSFSPLQRPLQGTNVSPFGRPIVSVSAPEYIAFPPPHVKDPEADDFKCEYPTLLAQDWEDCSTPTDRSCWLRNKKTGAVYDINTDYEKIKPPGKTRVYNLTVNRAKLNQDGVVMPQGVVFDDGSGNPSKYPGPWIRACWGDTVIVNVKNDITKYNGTTIHWHGIRQLNTFQNDGVNGVTQCPIAPGDSFEYKFETWQYGTTWYHSHYSLQYADGLVGPLTIYGPSSANWDEAKRPTLFTDWDHRSAFEDYSRINWANHGPGPAIMDSILLNGVGNFAGMNGPRRYNLTFEPGKKYLLRLINTAIDTSFVFAIDNHKLEVMSSDFVPIKPYMTDHVVVAIGQRYHVVVHAPTLEELETINNATLDKQNFWIRTIPATRCSAFELGNEPDERQGIVRYDQKSTVIPRTARGTFDITCRDEDPKNLVPVLPWKIGPAVNNWTHTDFFEVGISPAKPDEQPLMYGNFAHWSIGRQSLWLDFQNPSIDHIDEAASSWDAKAVVVPENVRDDDWVYLFISGNVSTVEPQDPDRRTVPASHPIHLHGHDFAILQQSNQIVNATNFKDLVKLNLDNPPRRDVVLLPAQGFMVIAFKADNPGVWIMHCHIAFHASGGLALQVLERQKDIQIAQKPGWKDKVDRGCKNWKTFFADPKNLWDSTDVDRTFFQDDSGI